MFAFWKARPVVKTAVIATGGTGAWVGLCLTFLGAWEGLSTHTYRDSVGVLTACYGMTNSDRKLQVGDTFTKDECLEFLKKDLPKYNADAKRCIPNLDTFPPHRHASIVSFTYNLGSGALCKSSVARYINAGDVTRGCNAMMAYDKGRINGQLTVIKGLHNRRVQEREWCLRSD